MSENIEDYKKFLEEFKQCYEKYEKKLEKLKKQGESDYNIFNALYSNSNEVRHTMFLQSFLDPEGLHYQKDFFLSAFVEACELKKIGLETSKAKVVREYKNIDIYITDENKHIIIENKIWTGDHDEQIARYIQAIVDEQDEQDEIYERILVLYLTPFDTEIKSLGGIDEVGKDYLKLGQNQVAFRHISYKNEILKWIEKIKNKTENLPCKELFVLFCQYEKVIKNIVNKGDEMANAGLKELIREYYTTCIDIYNNVNIVESEIVSEFLEYLHNALKEKLKYSKTWRLQEYNRDNIVKFGKIKGNIKAIVIEHKKDNNKNKIIQIEKDDATLVDMYLKCENNNISIKKEYFNDYELAVFLYNKKEEEQIELADKISERIKKELDNGR